MENYNQIIQQILNQGENSQQLMQEAVKKYPYCTLPILLYLKNNTQVNDKELIAKAKEVLMERNHMEEEEAHRYLQKCSMESGTGLVESAQMVLTLMDK